MPRAFRVQLVALRLQAAQVVLPVTRKDLKLLYLSTVIALQALAHGAPHGAPAHAEQLAVHCLTHAKPPWKVVGSSQVCSFLGLPRAVLRAVLQKVRAAQRSAECRENA